MNETVFTDLVAKIIPYAADFAQAISVFLFDVVLRLLGGLYMIAKLTPWRGDDILIEKITGRVKKALKKDDAES